MEMPLLQSGQFVSLSIRPGLRRAILVAALVGIAQLSMLHAQNAAPALTAIPDASAIDVPAAQASTSNALSDAPTTEPGAASATASQPENAAPQWNRSMLDPFQPGPNFGNFSGSSTAGMNSPARGGFGSDRRNSGVTGQMGYMGINGAAMGDLGMRGHQNGVGPVFPAGGGPMRGPNGLIGAPPGVPSFNQLMRGSYRVPLNSGSSRLRFNFQDQLRAGANLNDLARPTASAMFSTSDLGNGMFLSAGTSFGRMNSGAPAAGLGSNLSGEGKHSGPSLAIKLSF
jgi:hypothetical protein